jgi:hypothetical protein
MKRTHLAKMKGLGIQERMKQAATPGRFAGDAAQALDRREQRKLEREQGLLPFAVKLDGELVKEVRALATERDVGLNELVAELLRKGLAAKR